MSRSRRTSLNLASQVSRFNASRALFRVSTERVTRSGKLPFWRRARAGGQQVPLDPADDGTGDEFDDNLVAGDLYQQFGDLAADFPAHLQLQGPLGGLGVVKTDPKIRSVSRSRNSLALRWAWKTVWSRLRSSSRWSGCPAGPPIPAGGAFFPGQGQECAEHVRFGLVQRIRIQRRERRSGQFLVFDDHLVEEDRCLHQEVQFSKSPRGFRPFEILQGLLIRQPRSPGPSCRWR